jgi:hypothetical protein
MEMAPNRVLALIGEPNGSYGEQPDQVHEYKDTIKDHKHKGIGLIVSRDPKIVTKKRKWEVVVGSDEAAHD